MFNEDVEYLYELLEKGTVVWIVDKERIEEYGIIIQLPNEETTIELNETSNSEQKGSIFS